MTYVVRPTPVVIGGATRDMLQVTIVLVGCGGTGGFVAESLCRLMVGVRRASLFLVDPDRVEQRNVARQAFDRSDVGRFKAEVLAERLSHRFGREIGYSVLPYDQRIHAEAFGQSTRLGLVIGAVDNAGARSAIARTLEQRTGDTRWAEGPSPILWLDSGNGRDSGQVLLGNAVTIAQLRHSFHEDTRLCTGLPAPGLQRPDLLSAPPSPAFARNPSCAQQVEDGEQGRTINQLMAGLVAACVERLLDGTCCWMATYLDLTDGLLRCVPAEPRAVSACTGVPIVSLIDRRGHASVAS
ncbi:MAG: ThiF family adenylyltransferase [Chloroflexi bacterium]|nr:ThiF family adenylyltransferase [Chloroflexota bacterium]